MLGSPVLVLHLGITPVIILVMNTSDIVYLLYEFLDDYHKSWSDSLHCIFCSNEWPYIQSQVSICVVKHI